MCCWSGGPLADNLQRTECFCLLAPRYPGGYAGRVSFSIIVISGVKPGIHKSPPTTWSSSLLDLMLILSPRYLPDDPVIFIRWPSFTQPASLRLDCRLADWRVRDLTKVLKKSGSSNSHIPGWQDSTKSHQLCLWQEQVFVITQPPSPPQQQLSSNHPARFTAI